MFVSASGDSSVYLVVMRCCADNGSFMSSRTYARYRTDHVRLTLFQKDVRLRYR